MDINTEENKTEQSTPNRRSTRKSILRPISQDLDTSKTCDTKSININLENNLKKQDNESPTDQTCRKSNKSKKDQTILKKLEDKVEINNEIKDKLENQKSFSNNEIETNDTKWKEGMLMEARDTAGKWYKSRIADIDLNENKVLVHFLGWNSRYDQWFDTDSDDLRVCAGNDSNENEIRGDDAQVSLEKIEVGTQVLAKWNDQGSYPANVIKNFTKNGVFYYQVKFYDGIKKSVRFNDVKIMTEEDAKYFNVQYNQNDKIESKNVQNEKIESSQENLENQNSNKTERHVEAELLLAIQEPKINKNDEKNESEKFSEEQKQQESELNDQKEDKFSEIKENNEQKLKQEVIIEEQIKTTISTETPPSDSVRKSLRAKKLRKFTKEFVFDSPASIIAYNLASVSDPSKLVPDTATIQSSLSNSQINSKKRKHESINLEVESKSLDDTNLDDSVFEPSSEKDIEQNTRKKSREQNTKLIQNYFKSLKIFKSSKKQTTNSSTEIPINDVLNVSTHQNDESIQKQTLDLSNLENAERSKSGRIRISSKRKQEYEEEKAEEKKAREEKRRLKQELKKQKESKPKNEDASSSKVNVTSKELKKLKKKMEKKKLKKNKKKLLKQLIESSQQQLKQQQELIEKQLKKHEHKKSQKKLQKILKQQQLQLQLQIQHQLQLQQQQIQTSNFNIFFPPTPKPSSTQQQQQQQQIFNNFFLNKGFNTPQLLQNSKLLSPIIQMSQTSPSKVSSTSSNEQLQCHFEDCKKKFRKQSLLEYHLKYHHYALQQTPASPGQQTLSRNKKTTRQDSNMNEDSHESFNYYDGEDPYEVIHCKCGNNINEGFMIQCEICLCWQHGDCMNIKSTKQSPKNYLCWICRVPTNKLKQLKYQNWMSELKNKDLCISESSFKLDNSVKTNIDTSKLKLLNECSKKYYNLNLLMYTLEYQMSLLNKITQENESLSLISQEIDQIGPDTVLDEETIDQVEKLLLNISHLQNCLNKKFEQFNSKIDEFELKYKCDEDNLISRNFNLEELYSQLQTLINRDETNM